MRKGCKNIAINQCMWADLMGKIQSLTLSQPFFFLHSLRKYLAFKCRICRCLTSWLHPRQSPRTMITGIYRVKMSLQKAAGSCSKSYQKIPLSIPKLQLDLTYLVACKKCDSSDSVIIDREFRDSVKLKCIGHLFLLLP